MHAYRTHNCGQLRAGDVGKQARLSGWVHRKRDHGGLLFVDLRDHYGLTQCVITPSNPNFSRLEKLRVETVATFTGEVLAREPSTVNPNLPTGAIELKVTNIVVQSEAEELPLPVFAEPEYPEDIRLKYRFLDLRRETIHRNVVLRSAVISSLRRRMI
jgi:aspartyl-tRNA synthetase